MRAFAKFWWYIFIVWLRQASFIRNNRPTSLRNVRYYKNILVWVYWPRFWLFFVPSQRLELGMVILRLPENCAIRSSYQTEVQIGGGYRIFYRRNAVYKCCQYDCVQLMTAKKIVREVGFLPHTLWKIMTLRKIQSEINGGTATKQNNCWFLDCGTSSV